MKNRKLILKSLVIGSFLFMIGFAFSKTYTEASTDIKLSLDIPDKVYKLGEVIPSRIIILNKTSEVIYLPDEAIEGMSIQISSEKGSNYKYYVGQGRGFTVDGVFSDIEIGPKASFIKPKTILWNYKPDVSHLNSDAAKPLLEDRILTDYAFTKSGIYFIKAVLMIPKDGKSVKIESEPIKITIEEPVGEDLEVWNKIKDNGEFAYFIQEGDITRGYHKPEEREKFLKEIKQIVNQYPNSLLANQVERSLEKFQAAEAKRQESLQKMQKQKEKPQ